MQDRYAFDVGDFAKLGLIRALAPDLRVGLLWYAFAPRPSSAEARNGDGRHVSYLERAELAACDGELHRSLRRGLSRGTRTIAALIRHAALPARTLHHLEHVPVLAERAAWFASGMRAVQPCALVVADPDNGMARPQSGAEARGSRKHMLLAEAEALFARGQSLLLYHHLNRIEGSHEAQVALWQARLAERLRAPVWAFRFRRGSSRVFYLVAAEAHRRRFAARVDAFARGPWVQGGHFDPPVTGGS